VSLSLSFAHTHKRNPFPLSNKLKIITFRGVIEYAHVEKQDELISDISFIKQWFYQDVCMVLKYDNNNLEVTELRVLTSAVDVTRTDKLRNEQTRQSLGIYSIHWKVDESETLLEHVQLMQEDELPGKILQ
jgi:hypothetical protein